MEKRVNEVEQIYHDQSKKQPSTSKGSTLGKDERQVNNLMKLQQDNCSREAAAAKRMQQLISQFGVIVHQASCFLLVSAESNCIGIMHPSYHGSTNLEKAWFYSMLEHLCECYFDLACPFLCPMLAIDIPGFQQIQAV